MLPGWPTRFALIFVIVSLTPFRALAQAPEIIAPRPVPVLTAQPKLETLPDQARPDLLPPPAKNDPPPAKRVDPSPFLERAVDPDMVVELTLGIPRLLVFKTAPKRIQLGGDEKDPNVAMTVITEREISLLGQRVGQSALLLWFPDPANPARLQIVSYLLRVVEEKGRKTKEMTDLERLQRYIAELETQINHSFPNSKVCLRLVGENLLVTGFAYDIQEAGVILRMVGYQPTQTAGGANTARTRIQNTFIQQGLDATAIQTVGAEEVIPPAGPTAPARANPTLGLRVVNMLKVPGEQQVMLKVVVAEINRSAARSMGVNFEIRNNQGITVFANRTGGIGAEAGLANLPAVIDNGRILLAINALKTHNLARTLAEPNLVTLNGQPATFQAGGQFPVPVVTGFTAAGLQGVQFIPFGVELRFTPAITDKDRIRLDLNAQVSTRNDAASANVGGTNVPSLDSRNFSTMVELREGQTLAVAGLLQHNFGADATRVPLLGEIPLFGKLWSFDRTSRGEQELVILVTPMLVGPVEPHQKQPLPGSDTFEPSDAEFFLHGRLESHRPFDYRSTVRTDWDRKMEYHRQVHGQPPASGPAAQPETQKSRPILNFLTAPFRK